MREAMNTITLSPDEEKRRLHVTSCNEDIGEFQVFRTAKGHNALLLKRSPEYLKEHPEYTPYVIWPNLDSFCGWTQADILPAEAEVTMEIDGFSLEEIEQAEKIMEGL